MSLNCNEIDLILSELNLEGSFIQDVVQPGFDSIALYTYRPGEAKTVFICLAPGATRLHEVKRKIPKNPKPLRFNELLKSRIKGARITGCSQVGKERIIKITLFKEGTIFVMPAAQEKFSKKKQVDQDESDQELILYIRLWSNAANIFLCDADGTILDSFYRRPAKGELSGEKFILPESKPDNREWPVRTFDEIEGVGAPAPRTPAPGALGVGEACPRTPREGASTPSFNQKVDLYYSQNAHASSLETLLAQGEKWYNEHRSRQQGALARLEEKRADFLNAGQWKHQGDLILSYGYLIDGKSQFLECEDYETGKTIRLKIDPAKSAQENAASYYETYKKQTSGLEALEHDIERSRRALKELDEQWQKMSAEKNPLKLEQLLRKNSTPKQLVKKAHSGLDYLVHGWQIIVGRDANENDDLLRHYVSGSDMWMHARDWHGGYVFIKNKNGKSIPLEVLLYAGNLAVYYSKARKNAAADLYYTQVKYLRRAKNGPKGLVIPTQEKNLFVKLDESKLRELEDMRLD